MLSLTLMVLCLVASGSNVGSRARVKRCRLFTSIGAKSTLHGIKFSMDLIGEIFSGGRGATMGSGESLDKILDAFQAHAEGGGARHRKDTKRRSTLARHAIESTGV